MCNKLGRVMIVKQSKQVMGNRKKTFSSEMSNLKAFPSTCRYIVHVGRVQWSKFIQKINEQLSLSYQGSWLGK